MEKKAASADMATRILREIAKMYGGNCNVKIDREKKIYKSTVILDAAGTGAKGEGENGMNTDAVLRMLIGVLGLMPTTFFLMQTLKWRGSITKVLILQISFNVLSCSAKEYMNLLSGQEVIGMTSWVLMAIYLSGVFLCFGDSLKRIILMVVIAIGCTTVAELICNAIFVNNGWLVTGSFWESTIMYVP